MNLIDNKLAVSSKMSKTYCKKMLKIVEFSAKFPVFLQKNIVVATSL